MIVRLLIWLIVGFLVYTVVQSIRQALQKPPAPPPEKTSLGEDMVKDPECGTYVPRTDSLACEIQGQRQHFCSERCRDKYIAEHP